jgi:hypothetical protein
LNGNWTEQTFYWLRDQESSNTFTVEAFLDHLPAPKDDFIRIAHPALKAVEPWDRRVLAFVLTRQEPPPGVDREQVHRLRFAVADYLQQAQTVDERLAQPVQLALKAAPLDELCASLGTQIGVPLRAARGVGDEKATVLVRDQPAREVMRETARLFGYKWARSGAKGEFRYELVQELKSQLEEEEERRRDLHQAFLVMDSEMASYTRFANARVEDLAVRAEQAQGEERDRLYVLVKNGAWGGAQLYQRLAPAERVALLNGRVIQLRADAPDRDLPVEWPREVLLSSSLRAQTTAEGDVIFGVGEPVADIPGAVPTAGVWVDRSELGQVTLQATLEVQVPVQQAVARFKTVAFRSNLAVGRSPAVSRPANAKANRALRRSPALRRTITLRPLPTCPGPGGELLRVTSADAWEEVHRRTGLNVIADAYTHLYPVQSVTVERAPLFDALCRVGDALGARWRKEGDFLLARSTGYFWDRLKEVPARDLRRWQALREREDGLPVGCLVEIAALTDAQLDSAIVADGIRSAWGIEEWNLLGGGPAAERPVRPFARCLASLPAEQRRSLGQPPGLPLAALPDAQQRELARLAINQFGLAAADLAEARLQLDYVPAGWYYWQRDWQNVQRNARAWPAVAGPTADAALTAARLVDPGATPDQIRRSPGLLALSLRMRNGEVRTMSSSPLGGGT